MSPSLFVPVAVGLAVVLQGGLNRQVSAQWGLAAAIFVNALVFLIASAGLLWLARARPELVPEIFRLPEGPLASISWWQWQGLLPGLFGLVIVAGLPWAIVRLGALQSLLLVLGAQLLGGLLWDHWVEGIRVTPTRLLGSLIALAGAWLVSVRR